MNKQYVFYVTLFTSVLLSACSSRHAPAPVSSLNTSVKPLAPSKISARWQKIMAYQPLT